MCCESEAVGGSVSGWGESHHAEGTNERSLVCSDPKVRRKKRGERGRDGEVEMCSPRLKAGAAPGCVQGTREALGRALAHLQCDTMGGLSRGEVAHLPVSPSPRHVRAGAASDEEAEGSGGQAEGRDPSQRQGAWPEE